MFFYRTSGYIEFFGHLPVGQPVKFVGYEYFSALWRQVVQSPDKARHLFFRVESPVSVGLVVDGFAANGGIAHVAPALVAGTAALLFPAIIERHVACNAIEEGERTGNVLLEARAIQLEIHFLDNIFGDVFVPEPGNQKTFQRILFFNVCRNQSHFYVVTQASPRNSCNMPLVSDTSSTPIKQAVGVGNDTFVFASDGGGNVVNILKKPLTRSAIYITITLWNNLVMKMLR